MLVRLFREKEHRLEWGSMKLGTGHWSWVQVRVKRDSAWDHWSKIWARVHKGHTGSENAGYRLHYIGVTLEHRMKDTG